MTSAGRRNRLVTIEQSADSTGTTGYPVEVWTTLGAAWMERTEVNMSGSTGVERLETGQVAARMFTEWTMPFRADMDPERVDVPKTRRLVYAGRVYDIIAARMADQEVRRAHITLQTLASSKVPA